jgi:uncharacterized protein (DUF1684 family)
MQRPFQILLGVLPSLLLMMLAAACTEGNPEAEAYRLRIIAERESKTSEFTDSAVSRFNAEERKSFELHGPQYYPPDLTYRVKADFTVDTSYPVFQMPTTTERKPNYRIYGYLDFTLKDTTCRLVAFQNYDLRNHPEHGHYLFIPFMDNTNEFGTYGGGRYIDLEIPEGKTTDLDFNQAYNPYCAYSSRWSCPLVPGVNTLNVAVMAGEKKYK